MKVFAKVLTLVALSAFSQFAQAEAIQSTELLSTLISHSSTAVLVGDDGQKLDRDLANLLADALAKKTLVKVGRVARIVNVEGKCEATDAARGEEYFECTLSIGDGDYTRTLSGYTGPTLESGMVLKFNAVRKISIGSEKTVLHLNGKIRVSFAG